MLRNKIENVAYIDLTEKNLSQEQMEVKLCMEKNSKLLIICYQINIWSLNRHYKTWFFWRGKNLILEILRKKKCKNIPKNHFICVKHEEEKNVKEVKMHNFHQLGPTGPSWS